MLENSNGNRTAIYTLTQNFLKNQIKYLLFNTKMKQIYIHIWEILKEYYLK